MKKEKSTIQEYFSPYKLRIWERLWEFGSLAFIVTDLGKNIQKEINWFVKNKFLIKSKQKGETIYKANLRNKIVKSIYLCFWICVKSETDKEVQRQKKKK